MIKVAVAGFRGKMGSTTTKMVINNEKFELVGVISPDDVNRNLSELMEYQGIEVPIFFSKEEAVTAVEIDVWIDFTSPEMIYDTVKYLVENNIHPVIGTTGLTEEQITELQVISREKRLGGLIAPNFAVGAILMMEFATKAAKYFPDVEIIELHHDNKLDAPSGTAINTAQAMAKVRTSKLQGNPNEKELIPGARGADYEGMKIHSVRLPGLIAHQQVQFGGVGEGLTIRHDSYDRESFMTGVALGCEKVMEIEELVYGLEYLL